MTPRAPLASIAALAALFALALAQQLCETTLFGNESQARVPRPMRTVEAGMFTLEISEPDVCSESEAVGLKVTACDEGQAPRVLLLDAARGVVVRAGALAHPAYVIATVYCDGAPPDSTEAPATDASTDTALPTATTSPSQLLSPSTPNSLPLAEVERSLIPPSLTNEYLPPAKLESRFSSIDQSNGPPVSTSFKSKIKNLLKGRAASSRDQLKSQSFPEGIVTRLQENEQSSLDKAKHQPSILESYSNLINSIPKSSSATLAKRLISLRPKQPQKGFENRAPAWKRRPTRRPSSPWLKLRSLPDEETRKSMPRLRHRAANGFDYNDPWNPYEDDPLSLQWIDERTDPNPWYTEGDPESPYTNNFPWRIKPPKKHNWKERPHPDRPSSSSIKHDSKKQSRFVPPIHEEDPALLLEWKKDRPRSKRPALPKLLLLLQDQEHDEPAHSTYSAHSVEDTGPWWLNDTYKSIDTEGIPWQPDYPADYTADDGDSRSYLPENYIDDRMDSLHVAPSTKRPLKRPPWYRGMPLARLTDAQPVHASKKPPPSSKAQPYEDYFYYSPTPLTERPLLTSTVRNSLPWSKGYAVPLKSPLKLKKPKFKKRVLEKSNHHYLSDHDYQPKPLVTADTNYPPEIQNPSNKHYPSEPHYPPETYNPSHLTENYFPSKPHLPSGPHYPPETKYPSEPHYPSESGNILSEPHYSSEPHYPPEPHYPLEHDNPSKPHFPLESDYPSEPYYLTEMENVPSEPYYPSEPHYPSGLHLPSEPDYPSEPYYPSVSENVPSEPYYPPEPRHPSKPQYPSGPHYPSEPDYSSRPRYPSEPHYPSEPDYPSRPRYPSEPHYPSEPDYSSRPRYPSEPYYPSEPDYPSRPRYPSGPNYPPEHDYPSRPRYSSGPYYPSEPDYASRPRYPSGRHNPSELDYQSQFLQSPTPWKFLSELLLTHPSFRDSTHVIRIR